MSLVVVWIKFPDVLQSGGSKTYAISLKTSMKDIDTKMV